MKGYDPIQFIFIFVALELAALGLLCGYHLVFG